MSGSKLVERASRPPTTNTMGKIEKLFRGFSILFGSKFHMLVKIRSQVKNNKNFTRGRDFKGTDHIVSL